MTPNYLLDTNALSEASKKVPDTGFMEWFTKSDELIMFTSCLVIGEIKKGVALSRDTEKREKFDMLLTEIIRQFDGRIVDIDGRVALLWGELMAMGQRSGKTSPAIDTLIAAQCIAHDLTLVTRNVRDFEQFTGLRAYTPWSE